MQRPYYSLGDFLRERFGCRVIKIPVHAGFDCPNRDGRVGREGCSFCCNSSFSPALREPLRLLSDQIRAGKAAIKGSARHKFLVYFQSYTNTYAPLARLRALYDTALAEPDVVGLCIATRPDCVPAPVVDMLADYARQWHLWLELGLQSAHDRTLAVINRGHTRADFEDVVARSRDRGFYVCAHVILGLPGEGRREMLETADFLSSQAIQGVKIHHLQIIEGTPLAEMYRRGQAPPLELEQYLQLVCDFLERLRPDIIIHRLLGEVLDDGLLLAPRWGVGKAQIIGAIEQEMGSRISRRVSLGEDRCAAWGE
ncbi:MAG: TIGR01212 family radical SAM protein [Thermacetogeniaceae bacterium]